VEEPSGISESGDSVLGYEVGYASVNQNFYRV